MNFKKYAAENYTNRGEFEIPRGFADASKMNTVDGEKQDYSFISPLRTEFYTEAAIVAGALTDVYAGIEFANTHSTAPALIFTGATAVIGIAAVIRHRAHDAVQNILHTQE